MTAKITFLDAKLGEPKPATPEYKCFECQEPAVEEQDYVFCAECGDIEYEEGDWAVDACSDCSDGEAEIFGLCGTCYDLIYSTRRPFTSTSSWHWEPEPEPVIPPFEDEVQTLSLKSIQKEQIAA